MRSPRSWSWSGRSGEILGIANLDAARGIDGARQGQVSVEAVVGRQPDGWVVMVDSREGDVSGLVSAVAASGVGGSAHAARGDTGG